MILVDSSVLIAFLRTASASIAETLDSNECAGCGVIRAEILRGARDAAGRLELERSLNDFHQLSIPNEVWDDLGKYLAQLRTAGLTLPFQDVLLAAVAIHHQVSLWSFDHHFNLMQTHLPSLRLFSSPNP